jgi:hypothetical protein
LHHEVLYVDATDGENTLQFRGEGKSDGYGHTIDNIKLYGKKGAKKAV